MVYKKIRKFPKTFKHKTITCEAIFYARHILIVGMREAADNAKKNMDLELGTHVKHCQMQEVALQNSIRIAKKGHSMTLKTFLLQVTASIRNILCGNYWDKRNREMQDIIQ